MAVYPPSHKQYMQDKQHMVSTTSVVRMNSSVIFTYAVIHINGKNLYSSPLY